MLRLRGKPSKLAGISTMTRAMTTTLPLRPLTGDAEKTHMDNRVAQVAEFFSQSRFKDISRPYSAEDVASKQVCRRVYSLVIS